MSQQAFIQHIFLKIKIKKAHNFVSGYRHGNVGGFVLECGRGWREEASYVSLLLTEAALEVVFEDLHDGHEALHLLKLAAQLGFPSPGAGQPNLRLRQPIAEILHRRRVLRADEGAGRRRVDDDVSG